MNARDATGLNEEVLARARAICRETGELLLTALEKVSLLDGHHLIHELAIWMGFEVFRLDDLADLSPDYAAIPFKEIVSRHVVAGIIRGQNVVLLTDPFDELTETWAQKRLYAAGKTAEFLLISEQDFDVLLSRLEREYRVIREAAGDASIVEDSEVVAEINLETLNNEGSEIVKVVNTAIYDALRSKASDIHLETDSGQLLIQNRIDGVLVPVTRVAGTEKAAQIISRIKVMADLDISERRVPQDGRFKVVVAGRPVDLRVSVMPSLFGEDAVLRLLDRQSLTEQEGILTLESLGLGADVIMSIRKLARKPHGMLLVTGPTGSGKTTTLYAAITEINDGREKIVTIEDPVEYRLSRVLQIPVNEKKGLTFARGLRSILRHDPDKIMVGEIRDAETAQIAIQSALTGHLVYTTVHANNVFDVLGRFTHMGIDAYSYAAAINGVVSQRLVRTNCPACSIDTQPDQDDLARLSLTAAVTAGWRFRSGRGCPDCRNTGYKGRKAVAEVLLLTDDMRALIASRATAQEVRKLAHQHGMVSLTAALLEEVRLGNTTLVEVLRVAG